MAKVLVESGAPGINKFIALCPPKILPRAIEILKQAARSSWPGRFELQHMSTCQEPAHKTTLRNRYREAATELTGLVYPGFSLTQRGLGIEPAKLYGRFFRDIRGIAKQDIMSDL